MSKTSFWKIFKPFGEFWFICFGGFQKLAQVSDTTIYIRDYHPKFSIYQSIYNVVFLERIQSQVDDELDRYFFKLLHFKQGAVYHHDWDIIKKIFIQRAPISYEIKWYGSVCLFQKKKSSLDYNVLKISRFNKTTM